MQRRTFLSSLSALLAVPALPRLPAAQIAPHLSRATLMARTHNRLTADMLVRHLKVSPEVAARIQAHLLRTGVVTAPVNGAAMATNPLNTHCIPNEALQHTNWLQKLNAAKARLNDVLERVPDPEEVATPPDPVPTHDPLL